MGVGKRIRQLRRQHKHSLEELGDKVDYNYSNLSKIELEKRQPSLELLEKIASVYGVHISYFFGERKNTPDELEEKGVEWLSFIEEMEKKELSPEEIREIVGFIDRFKSK